VNAPACPRESDVLDAVCARRWPDRVPEDLRAHATSCQTCAALGAVATALRDEHDAAWSDAHVPDAGLIWRRAQLRARAEAARTAARPISAAVAVALACAAGLVAAFFAANAAWLAPWFDSLPSFLSMLGPGALIVPPLASLAGRAVALAFVIWLVLVPVVLSLVPADE
jgi:hypothetical protein